MDADIENITVECGIYAGQKRALVDAIERAAVAGQPPERIAFAASALPADQVRRYVAAVRLRETARQILRDTGLPADVRVSGFDTGDVHLNLTADPADTGYEALPGQVRAALRGVAALEPAPGHHRDGEQVDDLLRDGETVRLAAGQPASTTPGPEAGAAFPVPLPAGGVREREHRRAQAQGPAPARPRSPAGNT